MVEEGQDPPRGRRGILPTATIYRVSAPFHFVPAFLQHSLSICGTPSVLKRFKDAGWGPELDFYQSRIRMDIGGPVCSFYTDGMGTKLTDEGMDAQTLPSLP